ncbi:MAG: ACP S-malonyltransferase [Anaerolineales bacterium]
MTVSAFLFPGQGSQYPGMGKSLAQAYPEARLIFEMADDYLGFSLSKLAWDGSEADLNDTIHTQPALLVHAVAALQVVQNRFPHLQPRFVAGHSLGELSALVAAGSLAFPDALRLVHRRGELMKQAGAQTPGGMAAILGLDIPTLEEICAQASNPDGTVQIANDNCPGQVVISGEDAALNRALEAARAAGARRAVRLAVSIAAHSALMQPAQQAFSQAVAQTPIQTPAIPVVGNVSAQPMLTPEDIRADLQAQLTSRVRWTESMTWMVAQGVQAFYEIGSGTVLGGLLRRITRQAAYVPLGDAEHFENLEASA